MLIGNPSLWLNKFINLEEKLLLRISHVWPNCKKGINSSSLENNITNNLVYALQKDTQVRTLGMIIPQYTLLDKDKVGDVVTKGIIDFALFIRLDHDVYLAYECKRLNVIYKNKKHSLSSEYVDEGMMRYISAQYAKKLPIGIMLGYVMDNDTLSAEKSIKKSINNKNTILCCVKDSFTDLVNQNNLINFSTSHTRINNATFQIRHALLPLM